MDHLARLNEKWGGEVVQWQNRFFEEMAAVYLRVDGSYVNAGLEKDKVAPFVVLSKEQKVMLAVRGPCVSGVDRQVERDSLRSQGPRLRRPAAGGWLWSN